MLNDVGSSSGRFNVEGQYCHDYYVYLFYYQEMIAKNHSLLHRSELKLLSQVLLVRRVFGWNLL